MSGRKKGRGKPPANDVQGEGTEHAEEASQETTAEDHAAAGTHAEDAHANGELHEAASGDDDGIPLDMLADDFEDPEVIAQRERELDEAELLEAQARFGRAVAADDGAEKQEEEASEPAEEAPVKTATESPSTEEAPKPKRSRARRAKNEAETPSDRDALDGEGDEGDDARTPAHEAPVEDPADIEERSRLEETQDAESSIDVVGRAEETSGLEGVDIVSGDDIAGGDPIEGVDVPRAEGESAEGAPPVDEAPSEDVGRKHLAGLLEALLFVSVDPLPLNELAKQAHADKKLVREVLDDLVELYKPRGIRVEELGTGWVFRTSAAYAPFVRDATGIKPMKLTRAQIETLAIVAYRQPITRPEIDDVRGVDSGPMLKLLLERDLVRILGKREEAGRPLIYGTTPYFLEFFGLKSLKEMPTLREFSELTDESKRTFEREIGEEAPDGAIDMGGLAGGEGHVTPSDAKEEAPAEPIDKTAFEDADPEAEGGSDASQAAQADAESANPDEDVAEPSAESAESEGEEASSEDDASSRADDAEDEPPAEDGEEDEADDEDEDEDEDEEDEDEDEDDEDDDEEDEDEDEEEDDDE